MLSCNSTYRLRYWNPEGKLQKLTLQRNVATALTACGIETAETSSALISLIKLQQHLPLAVLKLSLVLAKDFGSGLQQHLPLAVLKHMDRPHITLQQREALQQHLPLAVLKLKSGLFTRLKNILLQQHLPLAVLKRSLYFLWRYIMNNRCNSTYRLRYWNSHIKFRYGAHLSCCNSTYRLRYWNQWIGVQLSRHRLQQHLPLAVLKQHNFSSFTE